MKNLLLAIFAATVLFFSCKTTSSIADSDEFQDVQNYAQNFSKSIISITNTKSYFLAEIDLSDSDLKIKTYPKASGFSKPISVKKFAEKNGCFAAINANPFVTSSKLNPFYSKRKPVGIYIDNFNEFSEAKEKYAAIAFFREETGYSAKIFDSQTELSKENPEFAVGGFWTILQDEKIYSFKDIKDFRSAAGISKDGKKLYLFCGKKLSYMETAKILQQKNVFCAIQLDGGSSSQFYFCGKNRQSAAKKRLPSVILGFSN